MEMPTDAARRGGTVRAEVDPLFRLVHPSPSQLTHPTEPTEPIEPTELITNGDSCVVTEHQTTTDNVPKETMATMENMFETG